MSCKVLTLTQPWATLIAIGAKQIETRSWSTPYRGPLAIHAAKGYPTWARGVRFDEPFLSAPWRAGIKPDMPLPTGAIVAVCTLVDCVPTRQSWKDDDSAWLRTLYPGGGWDVPPDEPERSFGDYAPGRFAWLLADVQELRAPIPARGALGLWQWEGELGR